MKKIILIIIAICSLMLSYYCGKKVAYHEDEEYIDDLLKLDVYSEELLDMYYYHDTDYYIDSISNTNSYEEYIFLRGKLFNE